MRPALLETAQAQEQCSEIEMDGGVVRESRQRLAVSRQSFVDPPQGQQDVGQKAKLQQTPVVETRIMCGQPGQGRPEPGCGRMLPGGRQGRIRK